MYIVAYKHLKSDKKIFIMDILYYSITYSLYYAGMIHGSIMQYTSLILLDHALMHIGNIYQRLERNINIQYSYC